ncbi:MAG: hypothetical protein JXR97_15365, partial [Planctomycetes bacterium]|nr:hypothetical protein [Planctomycetota bacterium]
MKVSGKRGFILYLIGFAFAVQGVLLPCAKGAEGDLPSIKDLVKPAAGEENTGVAGEEEKPKFPGKLSIEEANLEAQYILPGKPICFIEVPNVMTLTDSFDQTKLAQLLAHEKVKYFFKNTPLGLQGLFTDLPPAYTSQQGIQLIVAGEHFIENFAHKDSRAVLGVYNTEENGLCAAFLINIGQNRKEPFETLQKARDSFLDEFPNYAMVESDHSDDFIDVIKADDESAELAYGIVRNYVVISTNAAFARAILKSGADGKREDALSSSPEYKDMGSYTDGKAHLRGYLDLRGVLGQIRSSALPTAGDMIDLVTDLIGRGTTREGRDGPGLTYYDLTVAGDGVKEHLVSPVAVNTDEKVGLPARLQAACVPEGELGEGGADWVTPQLVPYQPEFYIAGKVKPTGLSDFLNIRDNMQFGASPYAMELSSAIPASLTKVMNVYIGDAAPKILDGEVAFALLPKRNEVRNWVIVLSVKSASSTELRFSGLKAVSESNGVKIHCEESEGWEKKQCWAVFDQSVFKHIKSIRRGVSSSCLVFTSSGSMMQEIVDQAITISSLANNKDFTVRLGGLGENNSVVWYFNVPGMIGREYINTQAIVKRYFPRLKSISNLPPMSLINKESYGVVGGVNVQAGGSYCRSTILGPAPVVPSVVGMMTMQFPVWVRDRSRAYQLDSRARLGQ